MRRYDWMLIVYARVFHKNIAVILAALMASVKTLETHARTREHSIHKQMGALNDFEAKIICFIFSLSVEKKIEN